MLKKIGLLFLVLLVALVGASYIYWQQFRAESEVRRERSKDIRAACPSDSSVVRVDISGTVFEFPRTSLNDPQISSSKINHHKKIIMPYEYGCYELYKNVIPSYYVQYSNLTNDFLTSDHENSNNVQIGFLGIGHYKSIDPIGLGHSYYVRRVPEKPLTPNFHCIEKNGKGIQCYIDFMYNDTIRVLFDLYTIEAASQEELHQYYLNGLEYIKSLDITSSLTQSN